MSFLRLALCLPLVGLLPVLTGCGPSHAQIDPKNVVNVSVRPASGQLLYCPGDAFQIEVVAKLKDGTSCSNVDAKKGCMKEDDMVIAPDLVRYAGSAAQVHRDFIVVPDPDVLKTADTGMTLRAWLEAAGGVKSMEGEAQLKPVYDCKNAHVVRGAPGYDGRNGSAAPEVTVAITSLSTPFYPDAALIRVDWPGSRAYLISPSSDKPVRIQSQGGDGGRGITGQAGAPGRAGKDATEECGTGEDGGNGTDGLIGGRGGDGGPGGRILVILDDANADKLKGRLLLATVGGGSGDGGFGGKGGAAGQGGQGGALKAGDPKCKPEAGKDGRFGKTGPTGEPGRQGPGGPAPVFEMGQRKVMFANELSILQRIEAGKGK